MKTLNNPSHQVNLSNLFIGILAVGLACFSWTGCDSTTSTTPPPVSKVGVLTASDSSRDFGTVTIGSSAKQTLTLTNSGDDTLFVTAISISSPAFSLDPATPIVFPTKIAPQGTLAVVVTFTPTTVGSDMATLTISSTRSKAATTAIMLHGTGKKYAVLVGNRYEYTRTNFDENGNEVDQELKVDEIVCADTTIAGKDHCFVMHEDTNQSIYHVEANGDVSYYFQSDPVVSYFGAGWLTLSYGAKTPTTKLPDTSGSIIVTANGGQQIPLDVAVARTMEWVGSDSVLVAGKVLHLGIARVTILYSLTNIPTLGSATVTLTRKFSYSPEIAYFAAQEFKLETTLPAGLGVTPGSYTDVMASYSLK